MSVAAAVPRGYPPLLLDSTLVWARSTAFTSSQALASPSPLASPTCARSPGIITAAQPPSALAQQPSCCGGENLCDAIGRGFGFESDADGQQLGSCPVNHYQSSWGRLSSLAVGHSEAKHCGCHYIASLGGSVGVDGQGHCDKAAADGQSKRQEVTEGLISRCHAHLHTSTSHAVPAVAAALIYGNGRPWSFAAVPDAAASASPPATATAGVFSAMKLREGSGGGDKPPAAVNCVPALMALQRPSSPSPQPIPLPNGRSSNCERVSGGGAAAATTSRRPAYLVKPSAMTSQFSAAQRSWAATRIQAAWRGFRIRRLYLRLIVWRLRPPPQAQQEDTYCGIREFPSIPDLPEVSLFTKYGRPSRFRSVKRRVWFDLEGPFWATAAPRSSPYNCQCFQNFAQQQEQEQQQEKQQHQQNQDQLGQSAAVLPPATPEARRPRPRVPLRLVVPPRAEADVPMSEVERILAGGFWRLDDQRASGAPGGAGGTSNEGEGSAGEGEEGLSLYMRAKMRQEEREAEDALQMLSYEPHDLLRKLGSLKERTLERLGSLGRTIGETLSSGLLLGSRGHGQGHDDAQRAHGQQQSQEHGLWHWHWHWHTTNQDQGGAGVQARSLPRAGRWGACGGVSGRSKLYCNGGYGLLSGGGGGGDLEWNLRLPLLTVVGPDGHSHTEVPPGAVAIPIAINWQRYRSRSHVTRMSF
ncbi:hypothetical protein Vretifemale_15168 [Volvox reticuliferus]|uniref:Uncharacterized protein n=1 Tax=Volvox reticuliferus TaxID=1737510 RepID=A0A8J4FRA3_9CHLO|nr:hypothetical protein Vretifemale_15168 [Volvox reticuliferus]